MEVKQGGTLERGGRWVDRMGLEGVRRGGRYEGVEKGEG